MTAIIERIKLDTDGDVSISISEYSASGEIPMIVGGIYLYVEFDARVDTAYEPADEYSDEYLEVTGATVTELKLIDACERINNQDVTVAYDIEADREAIEAFIVKQIMAADVDVDFNQMRWDEAYAYASEYA